MFSASYKIFRFVSRSSFLLRRFQWFWLLFRIWFSALCRWAFCSEYFEKPLFIGNCFYFIVHHFFFQFPAVSISNDAMADLRMHRQRGRVTTVPVPPVY